MRARNAAEFAAEICGALKKNLIARAAWSNPRGLFVLEVHVCLVDFSQASKFIFAFGVEQLEGAVVVGFRHEDLGGAAQIAIVGQGGINKRLRGGYAVLFQHHDEHLSVDERAGVEKFHGKFNAWFLGLEQRGFMAAAGLSDLFEREDQQSHDQETNNDAADEEEFIDLVGFLGKGGVGVKTRRPSDFFQIAQADAARDDHGGIHLFLGGSRSRGDTGSGGCWSSAFDFEFQFHLAKAQGLAGLEDDFGNLLAVDVGTVRGVQVADQNIAAVQQDFAVMAGNGGVGDLKRVVIHPANGGAVHGQFVGATSHALVLDNKLCHKLR